MKARKFGSQIQNIIKQPSKNHIILQSRSFSFQSKNKPSSCINRRITFADPKPPSIRPSKNSPLIPLPPSIPQQPPYSLQQDEQLIPKLLPDCISYLRLSQKSKTILIQDIKSINYLYLQKRSQIIDWLIKIHYNLHLFPQTLFIAVYYLDSYCSKQYINPSQYYLLATTCIFVASKYQQTYQAPTITKIQQFTTQQLIRQNIIQMQQKLLKILNYNLIITTSFKYLQLLTKIAHINIKNFYIAQYILQLALIQSNFLQYQPSLIGSAVVYLVNKIRKITPSWSQLFKDVIGYQEGQIRSCAKYLCSLLERSQHLEHAKNVKYKFSKTQFWAAANIRLQKKN